MMLILGPLVAPRISALTTYLDSSAAALTTLSPSTTSSAGNVTVEPTSPASLSTVSTSSTATFSCLPPQRTIAYTRNPSGPSPHHGAETPGCPQLENLRNCAESDSRRPGYDLRRKNM